MVELSNIRSIHIGMKFFDKGLISAYDDSGSGLRINSLPFLAFFLLPY